MTAKPTKVRDGEEPPAPRPYQVIYAVLPNKIDWVYRDDGTLVINSKKRGD